MAAAPLSLWALLRASGLQGGALFETTMLFTPPAAVAGLFAFGLAAAWRNWAATAVLGLATLCFGIAILPRAIGGETVSADGRETIEVLAANVYLGRADADALAAEVDRLEPDLLTVEELTPSFARRLAGAGIGRRLPYRVLMPEPGGRGGGIYSRHPLSPLAAPQVGFRMPRAALILPGGERLRVVAVHPPPPSMAGEWRAGLRGLPAPGDGPPWILAGDFNATFDHVEFRDLVGRGYVDAGKAAGRGLEPTWPGDAGFPLGLLTIDHVLADRRLGVVEYGVEELAGSDHRAVHARLALPW